MWLTASCKQAIRRVSYLRHEPWTLVNISELETSPQTLKVTSALGVFIDPCRAGTTRLMTAIISKVWDIFTTAAHLYTKSPFTMHFYKKNITTNRELCQRTIKW